MKRLGIFTIFCFCVALIGCDLDNGNHNGGSADVPDQPVDTTDNVSTELTKPSCEIAGSVLDNNEFWAKGENLLIVISAAEETNDPDFGESHRILEVYDGRNCEQVMREVLPVNQSPDFPYYLSDITYNNLSGIIAVRGFDKIFLLDLEKKQMTGPIRPKYLNERFVEDAQAGMINRLEVWEGFLIGHAQSMGTFVFDLSNPQSPSAVLPSAEYEIEEGTEYNSLFMLNSLDKANGYQILIPHYNYEDDSFEIGALMDKPTKLENQIARNVRDNRYIVLKELLGGENSRPIGIDMANRKKIEIPSDVAKQKTKDIVEWMKKN